MLFGFIGRLPRGALPACFVAFVLALGAGPSQAQNAVPVEVTTAESGAVRDEIEVVGNIRADESVIIRPEISGLVKDVHFSEGDTVEADDLLFSLDDEILSAEVTEAEAAHELAKRNYERSTKLLSRQVGTERTRDEALAEMQSSEAKLSLAKARLNKTKIRAPFSGIIGFREISVGAYVSTGTDLVRLVKTDPVEVAFRVPERFCRCWARGRISPCAWTHSRIANSAARSSRWITSSISTGGTSRCARASRTPTCCCGPACSRGSIS
jgi:membrane fusion protein (multidrug efflux system)